MTRREARLPQRFILEVEGNVLFDTGWTTQMDMETVYNREVDTSGRKYGLPSSVSGETVVVKLRSRGGAGLSGEPTLDQIARSFYERQAAKSRLLRWTGVSDTDREAERKRLQQVQREVELREELAALKAQLRTQEAKKPVVQPDPPQPVWPPPRDLELP